MCIILCICVCLCVFVPLCVYICTQYARLSEIAIFLPCGFRWCQVSDGKSHFSPSRLFVCLSVCHFSYTIFYIASALPLYDLYRCFISCYCFSSLRLSSFISSLSSFPSFLSFPPSLLAPSPHSLALSFPCLCLPPWLSLVCSKVSSVRFVSHCSTHSVF